MEATHHTIDIPKGIEIDHTFSALDLNYVNTGNAIGVGYIFEASLDIERLKSSLAQLLTTYPALAGRADFVAMRVTQDGASVPVVHIKDYPGSADHYAVPGKNITNRLDFVPQPHRKDILKGQAPLMCVQLTEFKEGGCILGATVNHGLMDAAGFHQIMRCWSDTLKGLECSSLSMSSHHYMFGTGRSRAKWKADITNAAMPAPLNFNTLAGKLMRYAMFTGLDKIRERDREMVTYKTDQITELKRVVQAESGLDWISTNVALSAHILHAIIPLQLSSKTETLGIGNVINLRGRLSTQSHQGFVGNALYIMISQLATNRPIASLTRGEIAQHLQSAFAELTEPLIRRNMANIIDALEAGFGYPGLNLFKPIMAINNQAKFDVYNVDFGAGRPLRVLPQDVGDHIMIFPAPDGGIEVYIRDFTSLKRQKKLLEPDWQARLMTIEG